MYDDKLTITFNVGENPLTVTKSLLRDINSNLKNDTCSYIEQCSPPKKHSKSYAFSYVNDGFEKKAVFFI